MGLFLHQRLASLVPVVLFMLSGFGFSVVLEESTIHLAPPLIADAPTKRAPRASLMRFERSRVSEGHERENSTSAASPCVVWLEEKVRGNSKESLSLRPRRTSLMQERRRQGGQISRRVFRGCAAQRKDFTNKCGACECSAGCGCAVPHWKECPLPPAGGPNPYATFEELVQRRKEKGATCDRHGEVSVYAPDPSDILQYDCRLAKAAQKHAEDMVARGYFSHFTLRDDCCVPQNAFGECNPKRCKNVYERWADEGFPEIFKEGVFGGGENIASGVQETPTAPLDRWERSIKGHCNFLYNPHVEIVGLGAAQEPGGRWMWVLVGAYKIEGNAARDTSCIP